ncbi:hypothetical protein DYB36_006565 [Aphanomyces astaci]|uniref:Uncharacterized protein n=1 Tax=Aphanomyces astaci TaxID=112090 RepID=A0A397AC76_APHAT|nr:hypothetical protein DYB36_006565 [Aphanomyces astaci]
MPPRTTPFQSKHCLEFGLEIVSRDQHGNPMVRCNFCTFEGRDKVEITEGGTRKRKSRVDVKYFTKPFTPLNFRSHLNGQHNESWEAYQQMSTSAKKEYFNDKISSTNTLHVHMDLTSDSIEYTIKAPIVDTIIGGLFFNAEAIQEEDCDDAGEDAASAASKKINKLAKQKNNAMLLFKQGERASNGAASYTVVIKNTMRYQLAIDHVGAGMSFKQTALAIGHAKNRAQVPKLAGINDLIVGQYVRVQVAAGDGSTHRGQSFFDLRLRLYWHGRLLNLHLVALPMFDCHTAENMFNMIVKLLDALFPKWRAKLIGVSSDGENTMTGRHRGLVTRLVAAAEYNVMRVWCAPHQIDIIAKKCADRIDGGTWIKFAYSYTVYLRTQFNLIIEMGAKCPKKTNRWVHLGNVLKFLKENRRRLMTHTEEDRPDMLPSDAWWTVTYAIAPAIDAINIAFAQLQNRSLLMAQQESHIIALVATISTMFDLELIDRVDAVAEEHENFVRFETMRIRTDHLIILIEDQGSMARDCFLRLDVADKATVLKQIVAYAETLVIELQGVRAERDDSNLPREQDAPPVLPGQLVGLRPAHFIRNVLDPHRERILRFWSDVDIDEVEENHRQLVAAYNNDPILRRTIDEHDNSATFDDAWDVAPHQWLHLRAFCGGLATIFPNTTSVESDFSILKWEMDPNRTDLMHLSLEGIFQAKQRVVLQ